MYLTTFCAMVGDTSSPRDCLIVVAKMTEARGLGPYRHSIILTPPQRYSHFTLSPPRWQLPTPGARCLVQVSLSYCHWNRALGTHPYFAVLRLRLPVDVTFAGAYAEAAGAILDGGRPAARAVDSVVVYAEPVLFTFRTNGSHAVSSSSCAGGGAPVLSSQRPSSHSFRIHSICS